MGFNTVLHVQNCDLDVIAKDPAFGRKVYDLITQSDSFMYQQRRKGINLRTGVSLRDLDPQAARDYDVESSPSQHADGKQLFHIRMGTLVPIPFEGKRLDADAWLEIAKTAKDIGVESKLGDLFDSRKLSETPAVSERERMGNWDADVFANGTTTFVVLNDYLHRIKDAEQFGAEIKALAENTWASHKAIMDDHEQDPDQNGRYYLPHGSGVSVVGFTPWDTTDIMMIQGNTGRVLRAAPGVIDVVYGEKYADQKVQDIENIADTLRTVGFAARVGEGRLKPAHKYLANYHIVQEALNASKDTQESDLSI